MGPTTLCFKKWSCESVRVPIIVVPLFTNQPINAIHIEERGVGINLRDKLAFTGGDVEHAIETVLSDKRTRNGTAGQATTFSLKEVNYIKVTACLSSEARLLYGANIVEMVATTGSSSFLVFEDVKVAYWQQFGISNFGATCATSAAALLGGIFVWRNMSSKTKIH
ncbi:hypothetical protein BCR33DRAFT_793712 [Rhizoclosmatium globosum]|uniref:Uncharacterized protein n=1 Tax=Rhizoclosmatium globosum TaxID=329046 RepID=A0A1Y2AYR4_9FUNG|nr:hypothetical protein BCR33DRAFT_793712 [Rhizoclosmatium globosum]|eukprot:ORY27723.1 hypothetical protein BCR33DRAFT_793712 [Rhizoclosmatium globosum]